MTTNTNFKPSIPFLPFTWEDFEVFDEDCTCYFDVEFIRDFGLLKKGDTYDQAVLNIDLGYMIVEKFGEDGEVKESVKQYFKLTAI